MSATSLEANQMPPSYLEQVEQVVGVHFLFDEQQRATAYNSPELLDNGIVETYAATYIAGLRLLVAARRQYGVLPYQLDWQQRRDIRAQHHTEITDIREQLSIAAPLLKEPPADTMAPVTLQRELRLSSGLYKKILDKLEPIQVTFKRDKASKTGTLRYTAEDANQIRAVVNTIKFAGDNDLPVDSILGALHISKQRLDKLCAKTGIPIRQLRTEARPGELAPHITKEDYQALGEYISAQENAAGLQSVVQIATRAGVGPQQVRGHISARGWQRHIVKKPQRVDGIVTTTFYLPDDFAEVIVAELSIIVPYEYMTFSDYATLRGIDTSTVRWHVKKAKLPTHHIKIHEGSLTYIDGATIYELNRLIHKPVPAVEGWSSMHELKVEFGVSEYTIWKHLTDEYAGSVRPMFPRDTTIQQFTPHYPPAFREHLRTVLKPVGARLTGHTPSSTLARNRGTTSSNIIRLLSTRGVTGVTAINPLGDLELYFPDADLERALPTLPKVSLPLEGVDLGTVAALNNIKLSTLKTRILRAKIPPAGLYHTDFQNNPRHVKSYYLRARLEELGYKLPKIVGAAFPAGEPPYGKYGPAHGRSIPSSTPRDTPTPPHTPPKAPMRDNPPLEPAMIAALQKEREFARFLIAWEREATLPSPR